MKLLIALVLLLALAVAVMMLLRSSGPRITTIEHRRDESDDADEDRKGGDK